jgi:hypothetical protein
MITPIELQRKFFQFDVEISNKILAILKDIANDPEFQFDYNLGNDIESNLKFILDNKEVLGEIVLGLINDYKSDIELEKSLGENYDYLTITLNELESILEQSLN